MSEDKDHKYFLLVTELQDELNKAVARNVDANLQRDKFQYLCELMAKALYSSRGGFRHLKEGCNYPKQECDDHLLTIDRALNEYESAETKRSDKTIPQLISKLNIITDPQMPNDRIDFRNSNGELLERLENINPEPYSCPVCLKSFAEHHEDRDKWRGIAERMAECLRKAQANWCSRTSNWKLETDIVLADYKKESGK